MAEFIPMEPDEIGRAHGLQSIVEWAEKRMEIALRMGKASKALIDSGKATQEHHDEVRFRRGEVRALQQAINELKRWNGYNMRVDPAEQKPAEAAKKLEFET